MRCAVGIQFFSFTDEEQIGPTLLSIKYPRLSHSMQKEATLLSFYHNTQYICKLFGYHVVQLDKGRAEGTDQGT